MKAVGKFIGKYWKRLLIGALGAAAAGGAARKVRKRAPVPMLPEVEVDTGPIVSEVTIGQRIRRAVNKRKAKGSGGGGGGSVTNNVPKAATTRVRTYTDEPPIKRTPIPQRPNTSDVANDAQRARDTAKETAKKLGNDGPDFGIDRRHRR